MTNIIKTHDLRLALERVLNTPILSMRRLPCPYSSTFTIEELEVTTECGPLWIIFKNLSSAAILDDAARVKPEFLYEPLREINVYRCIHASLDAGAPTFYGAIADAALKKYWLFLERVSATKLCESGNFEDWLCAARWLAHFHASGAAEPSAARKTVPQLLEHDCSYYDIWLQRAQSLVGPALDRVVPHYERAIHVLLRLPRSMIHGEFYPSNILLQDGEDTARICPLDWEMAATGPGILDIAALASGNWNRDQRFEIARAWHDALPPKLRPPDLIEALDYAQLQIAVQWLGWSEGWVPPGNHAHDWLSEAHRLSSEEVLA